MLNIEEEEEEENIMTEGNNGYESNKYS